MQNDENCPPSARMKPEIEELMEKYNKKVVFYTININENEITKYYKGNKNINLINKTEQENIYRIYDTASIAGGLVATPTFIIVVKDNSKLKFAIGYGEFENEDASETGKELEKTIKYALSKY